MRGLLARWLILTGSILLAAYLIEGIAVTGFLSALLAAGFLGLLNVFFKPLLIILTLPINLLTFGLFTVVINALLLKMVSGVVSGLAIQSFGAAIWGAVIISLVNWGVNTWINEQGHIGRAHWEDGEDGRRR